MAVRARILVRNDSGSPLNRLALQISSSLQWTGVRVGDAPATFSQQLVNSDIDHTGALREAVIPLAQPLAPQQTIAVDLTYEGTAALSATRLEQIGTPAEVAEASDWDRVSDEFVGLGASATWLGTRSLRSRWHWATEPSFSPKRRLNGNAKARPP